MGIDDVLGGKRQAVLDLAQQYGATHVRVFGSVARGHARPDSDVDLLVDVAPDTGMEFLALWVALEDLLGCRVDLLTERALRPAFRERVLREAVPL